MLFDHAADHVTVPSREPKPVGPSKKASAGRVIRARKPLKAASPTPKFALPTKNTTAAKLGIRSFEIICERISGLGDAVHQSATIPASASRVATEGRSYELDGNLPADCRALAMSRAGRL